MLSFRAILEFVLCASLPLSTHATPVGVLDRPVYNYPWTELGYRTGMDLAKYLEMSKKYVNGGRMTCTAVSTIGSLTGQRSNADAK